MQHVVSPARCKRFWHRCILGDSSGMIYHQNTSSPKISGVYDYATIGYDDLRTGPFSSTPNYYHQPQQQYYFDCIPPVTFVPSSAPADTLSPHFRPPPSFPPPPPPPASILVGNSPTPISTATTVRLSDDSAFSDSSASPLQYHGDVVASKSGMLLRMDLSKNPPVFVQGIWKQWLLLIKISCIRNSLNLIFIKCVILGLWLLMYGNGLHWLRLMLDQDQRNNHEIFQIKSQFRSCWDIFYLEVFAKQLLLPSKICCATKELTFSVPFIGFFFTE